MPTLIDPSDALQSAVYAALQGSAEMTTAFGGEPRIFDRVPPADDESNVPTFPYVVIGDDQILDDGNTCFEASEAIVTLHVFSRAVGKLECKRILAAARQVLTALLDVEGQICVEQQFQDQRCYTESDGITSHGVLNHRYLLEPSEE